MTIIDVASAGHGAEVAVDWVLGEVLHDGAACPGWHPWNEAVYGPLPERQVWKWSCQECSDTGAMPADALQRVHDCTSRGPFDEVARLLVELWAQAQKEEVPDE
ncbi:hypothetical protein OVA26_16795 [Microbacterium sp. SL62]|uniref:hypothetical protein n=1 Tax=Microbacterium sp. SL62 TaxID=2995139 RepID=UPI002273337A|nr:hypothetical protein [Microbacterium sp. SL62]MCY1718597.1 hypothetical protein [Microbacterium sp. SL62]